MSIPKNDQDRSKGAIEVEERLHDGNLGFNGQLGHRDQDPLIKGNDTDFPEPGESPEHTGTARKPKRVAARRRKAS